MTTPITNTKATVILAGAGTGKSFTLKKKAKHLLDNNICEPQEILCLTFSNEATNDLQRQMREETGQDITVRTFHAFCSDVLKEHGSLIKVDESFELLLPDDAKVLVHKELGVSPYWANRYVNTISTAKDFGLTIDDIKTYCEKFPEFDEEEVATAKEYLQMFYSLEDKDKEKKKEYQKLIKEYDEYTRFCEFIKVWEGFDRLKAENNFLDYSDLTEKALQLLNQFDIELEFKQLFVDEFQDTNKLQFELIEKIAPHKNVTVVGDPNQSIYGFRGSYKESFEEFMQLMDATEFTLDKGYRCTDAIYQISYQLIKHNYEDESECTLTKNAHETRGENVQVVELVDAQEEARYIAEKIEEQLANGANAEDICILHRTHQQADIIKQALEYKNIPIISAGRVNIFRTPEIKTAISYLAILHNLVNRTGTGEQAWWNLFHFHNTLSPQDSVTIGRTIKAINKRDVPIEEHKGIDELLLLSVPNLSNEGQTIVKRVVDKLTELQSSTNKSLGNLVLDIYELTGLNRAFSHDRTIANIEALMNLKRFHEIAESFGEKYNDSLTDFIEYLEMTDDLGISVDASQIAHIDAVRLMTIHASKGLQFDTVYVCNMATDRFPVTRTSNDPLIPKELLPDFKAQIADWQEEGLSEKDIEKKKKQYDKDLLLFEERRLCYVAWTRAKQNLVLTYGRDYKNQPDSASASVFLDEIEYKENEFVDFSTDDTQNSAIFAPSSQKDVKLAQLKNQILLSLDSEDADSISQRILEYKNLQTGEKSESITFDASDFTFSPTALIEYMECPKKFELSKIYHMPTRSDFVSDGSGSEIGSFIHDVAEKAISQGFRTYEEFEKVMREMHPQYASVSLEEALPLLLVLVARNAEYHNPICEMGLPVEIDGFRFFGYADRVDQYDDGVVIIDYKTNKNAISPEKRAMQLGFYALALQQKGFVVKSLVLDMLRLDKPIVMNVEGDDVVSSIGCNKTANFKLSELKEKIVSLCEAIKNDYEKGFAVAEDDTPCRYCQYKFYCPKWEGR